MIYSNAAMVRIDAPKNLTAEKKADLSGSSIFLIQFDTPDSVKLLGEKGADSGADLYYEVECRIGRGEWESVDDVHFSEGEYIAIKDSENAVNTRTNIYSFRVRFGYYYQDGLTAPLYSLYSNIAYIGDKSALGTYHNASSWAVSELDKALLYGFITDNIKEKMNAPITREEICEVMMALYESMAGEVSEDSSDKFTDTDNPEILKASHLGIVTGVGNNRFDPLATTNREQVATMIFRAIKVLQPDGDFSTDGENSFIDEDEISSWALEAVKYMNRTGLLKGSNGNADPKGVTTREQAVLIATRAYEKLITQGDGDAGDMILGSNSSTQGKDSQNIESLIIRR